MIVECEQCHTKFKVDPDRIKDEGSRVRCSRCQHTFMLYKPALEEAPAEEAEVLAAPAEEAPPSLEEEFDLGALEEELDLAEEPAPEEAAPEEEIAAVEPEEEAEAEEAPSPEEEFDLGALEEELGLGEEPAVAEEAAPEEAAPEEEIAAIEPEEAEAEEAPSLEEEFDLGALEEELDLGEEPAVAEEPAPEEAAPEEEIAAVEPEEAEAEEAAEMEAEPEFVVEEEEEEEIEEVAPGPPPKKTRVLPWVLVVLLLLVAGGAGVWYFAPRLLAPLGLDLLVTEVEEDTLGNKHIVLDDNQAKHTFVTNEQEGQLLVITGLAQNQYPQPRRFILLRGLLHDKEGQVVARKTAYCGNVLSEEELSRLSMAEIEAVLKTKGGQEGANLNVPPGQSLPFMIVFDQLPGALTEYTVEVQSSQPVS